MHIDGKIGEHYSTAPGPETRRASADRFVRAVSRSGGGGRLQQIAGPEGSRLQVTSVSPPARCLQKESSYCSTLQSRLQTAGAQSCHYLLVTVVACQQ